MLHPLPVLVGLATLVCLFPVIFYFYWLALVHRRARATVLSGPWDAAMIVSATGGFLLIGGLLLLNLVQSDSRLLTRGNSALTHDLIAAEWQVWLLTYALYLLAILIAIVCMIRDSRRDLCIYNATSEVIDSAIVSAVEHAGISCRREGNIWSHDGDPLLELRGPQFARYHRIRLTAEKKRERELLEKHILAKLADVEVPENRSTGWISSVLGSGIMLILILMALIAFVLYYR